MMLSGWGRRPAVACRLSAPRDVADLAGLVREGGAIARGEGRAYGDAALSAGNTMSMRRFDRMLAFDDRTGQLIAEAGVTLDDIVRTFLPRGWFPAVTPGTRFVSVGGMIAADVHGKNHHRDGSIRRFVDWVDLMGPDGTVRRCSRTESAELFDWTIGGMGLTGVILRAALRLRPVETGWIRQTTVPAAGLDAAMDAVESANEAAYSVAWIDCLARGSAMGRAIVMSGEHATRADLPGRLAGDVYGGGPGRSWRVPADLPSFVLAGRAVRAFNAVYYRLGVRRSGEALVGWSAFFHPLDGIRDWNRIYGRRGVLQFQVALPDRTARAALRLILAETAASGRGSFLAVLKRLGPSEGPFSFPLEGYTLALDFPADHRSLALLDRLDGIAEDHGGRFYLAKDGRLTAERFARCEPRLPAFRRFRERSGLDLAFRSSLSERLGL